MGTFERWATCGAMWLTGDIDGPPLAVPTVAATAVDRALEPFGIDADVLAERAAILGLQRRGSQSCGRASRLLRCHDAWIALTLARPDDFESLPALFEIDPRRFPTTDIGVGVGATWDVIEGLLTERPAAEVVERGQLLGVPVTLVGEGGAPFQSTCRTLGSRVMAAPPPLVLDLTSLWAGPLATSCLARIGATVVKVEDARRPDGARAGEKSFYDLLNADKLSIALDFDSRNDRQLLQRLVDNADIVVTSARQRALRQLGLDPDAFLAAGRHRVWAALTAHGWDLDRVGFGDDVAAAAGLVAWQPDASPRFAGDATADPLGGVMAAGAALHAWEAGGAWFVDASLVGAASALRSEGPAVPAALDTTSNARWTIDGVGVAPPTIRRPHRAASALDTDRATVLSRLR